MEKVHIYKQHTITLKAEREEAGWVGKYSVLPLAPQDTLSHGNSTPTNFPTEEEADQAALEAAQRWIDHPS